MSQAEATELAAIDALIQRFYQLFDNRQGLSPWLDQPEQLFLHDAVIRRCQDGQWSSVDLQTFLAPRIALLRDGRLQQFHEWETESSTQQRSRQAIRFSRYQKAGILDGQPYTGLGDKTFQLIQLPSGWRIAGLTWVDLR